MSDTERFQLIEDCKQIISKEPVCLQFPVCDKKLVVIADTHGDFRTSELILEKYLPDTSYQFIFLGDELDRETSSLLPGDNIAYLLHKKREHPDRIFFLLGNHSLNPYSKKFTKFQPCSFWESLSASQREAYEGLFSVYPFMARTGNGVLLCHASVPMLDNDLADYDITKPIWQAYLWADFQEDPGGMEYMPKRPDMNTGFSRPQLNSRYFEMSLAQFEARMMIRGHDPRAPLTLYEQRCLTMQTTRAFSRSGYCDRRIAIIDLSKEQINSALDVEVLNIDKNFEKENLAGVEITL